GQELPEVDGALVAGGDDEPVQARVLPFEGERPSEAEEPGKDEGEPEEAGERGPEPFPVGAEGEVEEEEEEEGEERQRVQALLGPPLDGEVLPEHRPGHAQERGHSVSTAAR